jgi:hypothetical protein
MPLAPTRTLRIPSRYGVSFDGVDDYVLASLSPAIASRGYYTLMMWIHMITMDPATDVFIHLRPVPSDWRPQLRSVRGAGFNWVIRRQDGTSQSYYFNTSPPRISWVHVAIAMGAEVKLYANGVLEQTYSRATDYEAEYNGVYLASEGGYAWFTNSIINGLNIYNRVLSDNEISWNYQNIYNPVRDGLVLCLIADPQHIRDIDNDGILEWIDLSGNNNHGKIFGATLVDLFKTPVRTLPAVRTLPVAR